MMIKYRATILFTFVLLLLQITVWPGADCVYAAEAPMGTAHLKLNKILDSLEKRYAGTGFSADFYQESTLKEMDITDTAGGKIFVRPPGKMRWEYNTPEKQIIITDSKKLWIFRPEDNQVMVGEAPAFFGEGKGASFLSDMKSIRKSFSILPEIIDTKEHYVLKLEPIQKKIDITKIYLTVSKKTFEIEKIVTFNSYGDRTRIRLRHFNFRRVMDDSMFRFTIPEGVDVLQLD
jgi:outer membrane lipoprotein carrier protein